MAHIVNVFLNNMAVTYTSCGKMLAKCQLPFSTVHFQYRLLHNITLSNHEYEEKHSVYTPLLLCQEFYRNGTIYPSNETFEIDAHVDTGKHD